MKIATWNVNSIKARMHAVTKWLEAERPDIACLQEIKTVDEAFPLLEIEALGYNVVLSGQKSYNGVAILSKNPIEDVVIGLPGEDDDDQARYIEGLVMGDECAVRVASIYLPNGNPVETDGVQTEKYAYKLQWMARLKSRAEDLLKLEEPLVLAGDFNVIPRAEDCYDPVGWWGDAAYRPETHAAWRALLHTGLTEAFDQMDGRPERYTFWDYQGGAWQNNKGIRIDHLLLSPQAADCIQSLDIHRDVRDGIKPSDHVPVVGTFTV